MQPLREGLPIFFVPAPTLPFLSPVGERKGARGRWGLSGTLRSTGAETVITLFHRVAETHALPANVPLTISAMFHDRALLKA